MESIYDNPKFTYEPSTEYHRSPRIHNIHLKTIINSHAFSISQSPSVYNIYHISVYIKPLNYHYIKIYIYDSKSWRFEAEIT